MDTEKNSTDLEKTLNQFSSLRILTGSLAALADKLAEIPKEVISINEAMLELERISNATSAELDACFAKAANSAETLGVKITDVLSATAAWNRQGYSLADSSGLARIALLYKNIGNSIDLNTANSSLQTALKSFKLETEDAMEVIDRFNSVSDKFHITGTGIAEALHSSADSFYDTGTSLSKSLALIAGLGSSGFTPSSVGEMWNTVAENLDTVKAKLDDAETGTGGLLESATELRSTIQDITGFDILNDDGSIKDVYDIIVGIGHEWENLSRTNQTSLLDSLAGSEHGSILESAFENISVIEDAYRTAENSAGSALAEQQKYEQGVQYSLVRLSASWQEFADTALESDSLKGIIDAGNGVLNVLTEITDRFGVLGTLGGLAGLTAGLKNAGRIFKFS